MQTLMLGKTLAAGEIPVTRQREGGCEKQKAREAERGDEGEARGAERENRLRYSTFSKVKGLRLPAIST